jgi:hypothetical protein
MRRNNALMSLVTLMIWALLGSAMIWAQPTPPASLFGRSGAVETLVAQAPVASASCVDGC